MGTHSPIFQAPFLVLLGFSLPLGCNESENVDSELRGGKGHGHGHGYGHGHQESCQLGSIELPGNSLYPEGITADPDSGTLYVGGAANGGLMKLRPCASDPEYVAAPGTFRNVIGVGWDAEREAIWVCNNDLSFTTPTIFNLVDPADGSVIASHSFGAPGFCNDITFDKHHNIYATDSLGHRIVRVDADDADDDTLVETWAAPPEFDAGPAFSLNGITFDGHDRFYVAYIAGGSIFAVDIDDGEFAGVTAIELDVPPLAGPDGLYWMGKDRLLLVESGNTRISAIELDGDHGHLSVIDDTLDFPTTAAVLGDSAWVLEGKLDHMFGIDPNPVDLPFTIARVEI